MSILLRLADINIRPKRVTQYHIAGAIDVGNGGWFLVVPHAGTSQPNSKVQNLSIGAIQINIT